MSKVIVIYSSQSWFFYDRKIIIKKMLSWKSRQSGHWVGALFYVWSDRKRQYAEKILRKLAHVLQFLHSNLITDMVSCLVFLLIFGKFDLDLSFGLLDVPYAPTFFFYSKMIKVSMFGIWNIPVGLGHLVSF